MHPYTPEKEGGGIGSIGTVRRGRLLVGYEREDAAEEERPGITSVFYPERLQYPKRQNGVYPQGVSRAYNPIVQVIGKNELALYSYLDNVLEQHFATYQEEISELYKKRNPIFLVMNPIFLNPLKTIHHVRQSNYFICYPGGRPLRRRALHLPRVPLPAG